MKTSSFSRFVAGCSLMGLLVAGMTARQGHSQAIYTVPPGPPVRIVSPANFTVFHAPVDIPVFVFTHAIIGEVEPEALEFTNVEIYAISGGLTNDLGSATRLDATVARPTPYFNYVLPGQPQLLANRFHDVWCLVWSNAPVSTNVLIAVGRGRQLLSVVNATSPPVNVTILAPSISSNPEDIVSIVATDPIAIAGTNMSWVWGGLTNLTPVWTNWPPTHWGYFTNWGPKPALFTVQRFGNALNPLTINYTTAGTASNGLDYVALPGSLTIPAGACYGLIPIVPVDNGSNNLAKTVVLKLAPDTNVPPDYAVGMPKQAEALILYRWLRLPILPLGPLPVGSFLSDGSFHFSATGPDGAWFALQSSPDMVNWTSLCTNQVVQGSVDFLDPSPSGGASQFYQAVPVAGTPAQ